MATTRTINNITVKKPKKLRLTIDELPDVLEVKHVEGFLGIGINQCHDLFDSDKFHVARVGKRKFVARSVFMKWFTGSTEEVA